MDLNTSELLVDIQARPNTEQKVETLLNWIATKFRMAAPDPAEVEAVAVKLMAASDEIAKAVTGGTA